MELTNYLLCPYQFHCLQNHNPAGEWWFSTARRDSVLTFSRHTKVSQTLFFFFGHAVQSVDPSSLTRDWTRAHGTKAPSPNNWTTREVPQMLFFISISEYNQWWETGFTTVTALETTQAEPWSLTSEDCFPSKTFLHLAAMLECPARSKPLSTSSMESRFFLGVPVQSHGDSSQSRDWASLLSLLSFLATWHVGS